VTDVQKRHVTIPTFNLTLEYKSDSEIKSAEKNCEKNEIKTGYKRSVRPNQVKFKHSLNMKLATI